MVFVSLDVVKYHHAHPYYVISYPVVLGDLWVIIAAQLRVITFSLSEVGRPSLTGPSVSATYPFVWIHLGFGPFPGLHTSRHLSTPYCGIHVPLYAGSLVVLVFSILLLHHLDSSVWYSFSNNLRGMTLPLTPVSTFTQTRALILPLWSTGRCTMVYASVFLHLLISSIMIFIWITKHIRVRPD